MDKNLNYLCEKYQILKQEHFINLINFVSLCGERTIVYNDIKNNNVECSQSAIVDECKAFISIASAMCKGKYPQTVYAKLIGFLVNTYAPAQQLLNDENLKVVLGCEEDSLREVFKELKKHPHKAGFKIKITRNAIKDLEVKQNQLDENNMSL